MKSLKTLLAVLTFVITSQAQNVLPQLDLTKALTNYAVVTVAGASTTNLTAAQKKAVLLSDKGFGFSALLGASNAVTSTNYVCTFVFEFSVNGTNYWQQYSATLAPSGLPVVPGGTNFSADTSRNYQYVRLYSIQNTNPASVFVTNANFSVRQ